MSSETSTPENSTGGPKDKDLPAQYENDETHSPSDDSGDFGNFEYDPGSGEGTNPASDPPDD